MNGILTLIFSIPVGYLLFLYLSHPKKKKHRLPKISLGNVDFLPNFRVHIGKKTYHFHHWFILALAIATPVIIRERFQYPMIVQGFLIGGIIQGLRFSDRFKFRYPREFKQIEQITEQFTEQLAEQINQLNKKMKTPKNR
ncbi:MAG: hypothetical protein V1697_03015 [Candidatus Levyibacteriota bacterium]